MNNCPICSGKILRHINQNQIYWYCCYCRQTVPNLAQISISRKNLPLPISKTNLSIPIKMTV
ncbi:MAG TPA: hypothetical protein DCF68_22405 [Cyanothece sp. UBA12306]|nr:hypothetical protein [Cyanothece sp. UBA12306]